MTIRFLKPFIRDFSKLPAMQKRKVNKQLDLLGKDLHHPSLNTRKMKGKADLWEARIDYHYRFTFKIDKNTIKLRRVGTHEIYKNP